MTVVNQVGAAVLSGLLAVSAVAAEPMQALRSTAIAGQFASPTGLAYDDSGGLYVTEWSANRVSYIDKAGARQQVTGEVRSPSGIAVGSNGAVYVSSYSDGVVYRLTPGGAAAVFVKGLRTPAGLSIGQDGGLLIADRGLNQVLRADASGKATVLVSDLPTPVGVVEFADGGLVISNFSGSVVEVRPGQPLRVLTKQLGAPAVGMVIDGADAVLVADYAGADVWRVTRNGSTTAVIQNLRSPVAMARSVNGLELAVGSWGDSSVRRYQLGDMR